MVAAPPTPTQNPNSTETPANKQKATEGGRRGRLPYRLPRRFAHTGSLHRALQVSCFLSLRTVSPKPPAASPRPGVPPQPGMPRGVEGSQQDRGDGHSPRLGAPYLGGKGPFFPFLTRNPPEMVSAGSLGARAPLADPDPCEAAAPRPGGGSRTPSYLPNAPGPKRPAGVDKACVCRDMAGNIPK